MALELGKLRNALIEAGASPRTAEEAAEELAGYENRFDAIERRLDGLEGRVSLLSWMVGFVIALQLVTLGLLLHGH